jgi:hypothetical protein
MTNDENYENYASKDYTIEEIKSQLDKFMKVGVPVHIVYKMKKGQKYKKHPKTGEPMPRFHNGYIKEKKSEDVYIINEKKLGETYILIEDIFSVNIYASNEIITEPKKENENDKTKMEGH